MRESLEIRRNKSGPDDEHGINQDYGQYVKTKTWNSLLNHKKVMGPNATSTDLTSNEETTTQSTLGNEAMILTTSDNNDHRVTTAE